MLHVNKSIKHGTPGSVLRVKLSSSAVINVPCEMQPCYWILLLHLYHDSTYRHMNMYAGDVQSLCALLQHLPALIKQLRGQ